MRNEIKNGNGRYKILTVILLTLLICLISVAGLQAAEVDVAENPVVFIPTQLDNSGRAQKIVAQNTGSEDFTCSSISIAGDHSGAFYLVSDTCTAGPVDPAVSVP